MCLLYQEKLDNYVFTFQSYYDHFWKLPKWVYTDREQLLITALAKRICTFHLFRNVQSRLGKTLFLVFWCYYNKAIDLGKHGIYFKRDLKGVIKQRSNDKFNTACQEFKYKYTSAKTRKALNWNIIYEDRQHWEFCYTHMNLQQVYYLLINIIIYDSVGSHSTQRNESVSRDIKRFINHCVRTKFIKIVEI